MTAWEKSVSKRPYRERGQLKRRERLGALEKHKDYVKRARNYQDKKKRIKDLQEKARFRNPDEFYFKMVNSKIEDGVHKLAPDEEKVPQDVLQVMKTQDLRYVAAKNQQEKAKIGRLKSTLHLVGKEALPEKTQHTVFVDDEKEVKKFNAAEHLGTLPELVRLRHNRPTLEKLASQDMAQALPGKAVKKLEKQTEQRYKELAERMTRQQKLEYTEKRLALEKERTGKGKHKKVGSDKFGLPVYKWKKERKS